MANDSAISVTDFATLTGAYPDSKEVKWQRSIILNARGRKNPFYGLIGGIKGKKAIKEVMDFKALQGTEIVITLDRPLGGNGVQGPSSQRRLVGNEENQKPWSYRCKVGLFAHAVAGEQVMKTQAIIGGDWDNRQREKLTEYFKWKMATDIEYEYQVKAHARNTLYPNNRTAVDQLGTGDYLGLDTVTQAKELLNANQAEPFDISRSGSGAEILSYLIMGSSKAYSGLAGSNQYQQLLANAHKRGEENPLFRGGLPDWNGDYMYDWRVEDGTQIGPLAAPCAPVAYLAVDLPAIATTTAQTIVAGGNQNSDASDTTTKFLQHYENAEYVGHEGVKKAADVTTVRYIGIKILTGADAGKIAIYSYQVNNGNSITTTGRLSSSNSGTNNMTIGSMVFNGPGSPWTSLAGPNGFAGVSVGIVPAGSIIYQVNAKGTPYVKSYGLGRNGMMCGYGNLAPNKQSYSSGGMPGQRLIQTQDYGRVEGLGWQQVWGCTAARDANDMVNGYVLIVSAYKPAGWPDIP